MRNRLFARVRLILTDTVGGNAASAKKPSQRIALHVLPSNNAVMPGRSHNPMTKPVMVLRKRTKSQSAVPPPTLQPPPPQEDPAVVAARRTERIAAIQAVLKELMDRWPQTFSPQPQPV